MSTRKHTPRARGFRPEADDLERRQLLSAVVSGTDSKGDSWSLRLVGPGSLSVVKQNGTNGTPAALTSASDIGTITVGGTDPTTSRLVGTVTAAPNSDGRVFFNFLNELPNRSEKYTTSGNGLLSIDMPNFWLAGNFGGTVASPVSGISIPDGVDSLVFGGVDTTVNQPTAANAKSDTTLIALGLPTFGGTRIVINKSVTSTQSVPSTTTPPGAATTAQHGVTFAVSGRLDLFQANEIDGNAASPPGQFSDFNKAASGTGGTTVLSSTPNFSFTSGFFPSTQTRGAVTGQIGDVRIGGNATNFTTIVFDPSFSGGDKLSNYSIGGETNNVLVVAPNGARNVVFGKGMDTVDLVTHVINTLKANRGALNSNVYVDRSISRVDLGGDVVGTKILSGYQQNYIVILDNITGLSTSGFTTGPSAPPVPTNAVTNGGMTLHVAGDVTNSVFAASVQPFNNNFSRFGDPNQIVLPGGRINSKIEGTVSNTVAAPNTPKQAVFAQSVNALSGPVVPPNVPEAPYTGPQQPTHLPGIHHPNRPLIKVGTATPTGAVALAKKKG